MKTNPQFKRRDFVRTASAAGIFGLLDGFDTSQAAEGGLPTVPTSPPTPERLAPLFESIAKEHVTVPKEEGQFLNLLVKLTRARRVLELGTAQGYTTLWLSLALEETGGHLTTVEILPERHALARKHLAAAGLAHRVSFMQGDAHVLVPNLTGPFDIAYLDADKDGLVDYFQKLVPDKLPPGSLFIAHNAILRADAMQDYFALVRKHPEFDTVIARAVPEDGLALSYRRRGGV